MPIREINLKMNEFATPTANNHTGGGQGQPNSSGGSSQFIQNNNQLPHQGRYSKPKYDQSLRLQAMPQPLQPRKPGATVIQNANSIDVNNDVAYMYGSPQQERYLSSSPGKQPVVMHPTPQNISINRDNQNQASNSKGGVGPTTYNNVQLSNQISQRGVVANNEMGQHKHAVNYFASQHTHQILQNSMNQVNAQGSSREYIIHESNNTTSINTNNDHQPKHSILSTNGLMSLSSKIDAAKIKGAGQQQQPLQPTLNNATSSSQLSQVHAPGGGGYMLPQQQHQTNATEGAKNVSTGKNRPKQQEHPMLRKPGVYISSIQQINNNPSPGFQEASISTTNTGGNNTINSQQASNMFGSSQGFTFPGIQNNKNNNALLNISENGDSLMHKSMEGINSGGVDGKQRSQKFMIQPTFMNVVGGGNPQIMGPPPPIQLSNNTDEMTRNLIDAAEIRQIIMANRQYRPSLGQPGGGLQQSSTTVNQSINANGVQQMILGNNAKNDFIFNYVLPSQIYAPYSYQSTKNKQNNNVRMSGVNNNRPSMPGNQSMSESPPPLKQTGQQANLQNQQQTPYHPQLSQSVGPPLNRQPNQHQSIFNNFQQHSTGGGGHLFTYNEIRDHKKNLMNSLKRKGALNGGIIPNRLVVAGQQQQQQANNEGNYMADPTWAANNNIGTSDSPSKDKPQWDAFVGQDNTLNDLGKQFFVNSALVIQNFVFNLPGNDQQKNGVKLQGNQINFSKLTPIQQQQYLLQLQQQLNQQSQLNSLMNHYSQIGAQNGNNNRNHPVFNNTPFGGHVSQYPQQNHYNHDQQNYDIPFINPGRNYMGGGVRVPQPQKKFSGEQDSIMYMQNNNQGSQLADRSDTVLRIIMQNDYREKLKQIYAQTGKILEETLSNTSNNNSQLQQSQLTQEQLFQMRGNYQNNNNFNLSDLLMPQNQEDANYLQQLYGLDEDTLKHIVEMQQQILMNQQLQNGNTSFDRRRHGSATNNEGGDITPDLSPKGNLPDLIITQAQVRGTSLKRAGAIQIGNRGKAKHILKKQGSHNVKQKRGEDGQFLDVTTDDNNMIDDSCVPTVIAYDSSPGMAGRNPSSMRKQYCNSQQTMDRQANRKGSGADLNENTVPATERNDQAESTIKQASMNQRPSFNYRRVQATVPTKNQSQSTTNKPQTTQGTSSGGNNGINQRNIMSHSKSKNDLQNKPEQLATVLPEKTEKIAEQDEENEVDKDPNTNNTGGESGNNAQLIQQPLFRPPPKRIVNPYDEFVKEQERIQQARKEAKQKYTKISATQNQYRAPLKFIIREGNNHQIIQKIMNLRINNFGLSDNTLWEETPNYDSLFNFKWQPTSYGMKYDQISTYGLKQLVNHIEGHESITTKDQIFINLRAYCEKTPPLNVFDLVPLTFILDFKSDQIYEQFEVFRSVHKLIDTNIAQDVTEVNKKLGALQCAMERRTLPQIKNVYKMMHTAHDHKNIWLLKPTGLNRGRGIHIFTTVDELRQILIDNYDINWINTNAAAITQTSSKKNAEPQPTQPAANITVLSEDQLNSSTVTPSDQTPVASAITATPIQSQTEKGSTTTATAEKQSKLRSFSFVIQKYIEKPMLFKKRKFDIRVWVLLSFDFRCYLFRECYVRTSCEDYDLGQDNLDKIYVHLTNNAIQKFSDNYGKFEDGNQISLQELSDNLATQDTAKGLSGDEIKAKIESQHKDLIIHSLKAIKGKLKIRKYTYELVGYDFIIDEDLQSYIIEVNTNPCIEESSQLLKALVPRMLDDMFRLTLDQVFSQNGVIQQPPGQGLVQPPPNNPASRFSVPGYEDTMNMFEHIYSFS